MAIARIEVGDKDWARPESGQNFAGVLLRGARLSSLLAGWLGGVRRVPAFIHHFRQRERFARSGAS